MRRSQGAGLFRRRQAVPRLVLIAGLGVALVAMGWIAKVSSAGGSLGPTPSTVSMRSPAPLASGSRSGGASGAPGSAAQAQAPGLAPPAGSQVQDVLRGEGRLTYLCSGGTYVLAQTSIRLFVDNGGFAGTQAEPLTWRFKNGTRVDAALVRQVRNRKTLSQALFKVVRVHGGDANDRATTFIVRVPTSGGLPPATCSTPGRRVVVPLTTRYVFYRSALPPTPSETAGPLSA